MTTAATPLCVAVAIPLGIFGAGLLGWSPFGTAGFSNIGGLFGGGSARKSSGQTPHVRSPFPDMTRARARGQPNGRRRPGPGAARARAA